MKVILSSLAAKELVEESEKYESKALALGSVFIDEFETAVAQIEQFPESGHDFHGRFRRILMKRFPYAVIYAFSVEILRVVAIMHQHRGPEFITSRLEQEKSDNGLTGR